jgi:hypothetical protein
VDVEPQEIDKDLSTADPASVREERAATPETPGFFGAVGEMAGQTTGNLYRAARHAVTPGPMSPGVDLKNVSTPEELNEKYGLKGENRFTKPMVNDTAEEMVQALHNREKVQERLALFDKSHNWLTRNAAGFIGGMLDPVEAAAMMVPGIGEERLAFKMIEAGYGIERSVVAGKIVAGSTGAMAGTIALEPVRFGMSADELRDWSTKDALTNVFYAAPLGAMLHAGLSPMIGHGASRLSGSKPSAYFHDQYYPEHPKGVGFSDFTQADLHSSIVRGVEEGTFDANRAPAFGHIKELADMNAVDRHAMQSATISQLADGREPNAGELLFPDHSAEARKLAPEAHEEWDRLQAEHDQLAAEHVWGSPPTPEEAVSPTYHLEQELREHVKDILPVSWDLRVAASLEEKDAPQGAMLSLPPTLEAPQGFRGVHSTNADIDKIEKERFGNRVDAGYWGRGFYMFPYEVAKDTSSGTFYGNLGEGSKNYLIDVDSKNPFYIHRTSGPGQDLKTNWESLHAHGWTHDKAPIDAWQDRDAINDARSRVSEHAKKKLRDAEDNTSDKKNAVLEMTDDWGDLLEGNTKEDLKAAEAELKKAREEEQSAQMAASPETQLAQEFTDSVLKAGYDSIIITKNGKPYEMVGVKPGTLKSTYGGHQMYNLGEHHAAKLPIVAQGMADPATRTAWISAMAVDPKLVAREESGHAIRASGLFKREEWGILRDAAINRGWIDDMPKEVQDRYHEAYANRGPDGVRDAMVEEAVMQRFAKGPEAWGDTGGAVSRLMHRIKELLERVGNWMTSRGFQSANDIFNAMESGKISSRDTMAPHPARRMSEIEARMNELKPTLEGAYKRAKDANPIDLPSVAQVQRTMWSIGFAPSMPTDELQSAVAQIYGPKKQTAVTLVKPGEAPAELQIAEQRYQTMLEEGYKPTQEEIDEHKATLDNFQQAMAHEQGYQQAAECLLTAGI